MSKKESIAVKVERLTVSYDKMDVLFDINFSIPTGKMVGIMGPNGAGKSTLLKALLGMVDKLSGRVEFFGLPYKKAYSRIAYVPQRSSVDWDFPITVLDVVLMGRYGKLGVIKWPRASDKKAALAALEMVGLLPFKDRQISQLSGGQQQRLFIARALLQEADIYLMDEPFAGVDASTEKAMIALLDQLKLQGKTLFIVHHDLNTAERYFDWCILLNTCLVAYGPVDEVFHSENVLKTYGRSTVLLDEMARIAQNKSSGMK